MMPLTPEQIADGWIERDGALSDGRCDLMFDSGEVSLQCVVRLAAVAVGLNHIIAYRKETPDAP